MNLGEDRIHVDAVGHSRAKRYVDDVSQLMSNVSESARLHGRGEFCDLFLQEMLA
ncbi:hypothetical protein ABN028_08770 [Actinopolymorpha sp. B17G11]|uniref:hypothetical protein n=1 Tax=Actinopolymorpha sp. B17G11 TaxID=3160861 RepID=UPI0032E521ED